MITRHVTRHGEAAGEGKGRRGGRAFVEAGRPWGTKKRKTRVVVFCARG